MNLMMSTAQVETLSQNKFSDFVTYVGAVCVCVSNKNGLKIGVSYKPPRCLEWLIIYNNDGIGQLNDMSYDQGPHGRP